LIFFLYLFFTNLYRNNESTWGIAIHGPKRLLAVSANSHEITIFNLRESVQFFDDDDDDNLDGSEPQTPKSYASVLTKVPDNSALGGEAISVLQGHEHNIPCICFSACGRLLVSCSLDATCRIWNTKTGELVQTKIITSDWYYFSDEWYEPFF
jgi:WD40 repeat protein